MRCIRAHKLEENNEAPRGIRNKKKGKILTITHFFIVISDHSIGSFANPNRIHFGTIAIVY